MTIYSHSRIETFYQCPLKFKYQYIEKPKVPFHEGVEAFMGSRVHDTLEQLYKWVQHTKIPTEKELIDYYKKQWKENWNKNIVITKEGLKGSHYRNLGIKCIKNYYRNNKPFDDGNTIGLEKHISIDLDGTGRYKMQGFIDRLVEKENGHYEIHDYKTFSTLPEQAKADEDRQLALYTIGLEQEFEDVKDVELIWHYVVFGKEARSKRTRDQLEDLRNQTIERIMEIESCKKFEPNVTNLCNWCKYQGICPEWKHERKTEILKPNKYLKEEGVTLANKFIKLKNKESKLKEELDEIKEAVTSYAKEKGYNVIQGSNGKLTIRETESTRLPKKGSGEYEKLEKLLHKINAWNQTTSPDQTKIKSFLSENPNKPIESLLEKSFTTTIRVGKK